MGEQSSTSSAAPADASYRPEVDGLRALAVALVMLYHANVPLFAGGFIGVDIFFAISGFLITGIILRSAGQGRFSYRQFYMRRIRRIIPPLAVVSLLTLPFAWLTMMPDDLQNFGQSLVATALSGNNVLLWLTSGYFGQLTQFKPLFHTWSLGVEEQYYVLVPLLLMLALRWGGRRLAFAILASGSICSLLFCEYIRNAEPEFNFMMLSSRFWELGLGGMTAIAQPRLLAIIGARVRLRHTLVAAGLAAAMASPFLLAHIWTLPGWQTLLPIAGICLVLAFADRSGAGRLLAARPLVGLGLISYSAYLYHMPLYALLRVISLDEPGPMQLAATIPLCLALAWLSWRFVERRFRDPARMSDRAVLISSGAMLALMIAIGLVLHFTGGLFAQSQLAGRDPELGYDRAAAFNEAPRIYESRSLAADSKARNVLVIGNSYARDFINMGLETGALKEFNISYAFAQNCDPFSPRVLAQIPNAMAVVIGSGVARADLGCAQATIARLEALHVPHIIVLGTKQFGYNTNAVMLLPAASRHRYRARPHARWLDDSLAARQALPARYYLDLFALLDDGTQTVPVVTPDGKLISWDGRHLTSAGARYLGELVFAQPQMAWARKPAN
jgi:peptidoglycan/LPS O-acetylase OafA/YrhL